MKQTVCVYANDLISALAHLPNPYDADHNACYTVHMVDRTPPPHRGPREAGMFALRFVVTSAVNSEQDVVQGWHMCDDFDIVILSLYPSKPRPRLDEEGAASMFYAKNFANRPAKPEKRG